MCFTGQVTWSFSNSLNHDCILRRRYVGTAYYYYYYLYNLEYIVTWKLRIITHKNKYYSAAADLSKVLVLLGRFRTVKKSCFHTH